MSGVINNYQMPVSASKREHESLVKCVQGKHIYNPNGKHASLVICVRGNTIPRETHITMTGVSNNDARTYSYLYVYAPINHFKVKAIALSV